MLWYQQCQEGSKAVSRYVHNATYKKLSYCK